MRLSVWAARCGVPYLTVWTWAKEGKVAVPVVQKPSGGPVVYCWVSCADQKPDRGRLVARVVRDATWQGPAVNDGVIEVGPALTGRRRTLYRLLSDPASTVIVVEHCDRLARFGVEHLEAAVSASGRRLKVLDPTETTCDLVRSVTDVLASMCARRYGMRAANNGARRAIQAAVGEDAA
jgi:putative resolvase